FPFSQFRSSPVLSLLVSAAEFCPADCASDERAAVSEPVWLLPVSLREVSRRQFPAAWSLPALSQPRAVRSSRRPMTAACYSVPSRLPSQPTTQTLPPRESHH